MAELTDEQLATTMKYLAGKMIEAKINFRDPAEVIKYMLTNPLPDHLVVISELRVSQEAAKKRKIELLHKELAQLEDEDDGT